VLSIVDTTSGCPSRARVRVRSKASRPCTRAHHITPPTPLPLAAVRLTWLGVHALRAAKGEGRGSGAHRGGRSSDIPRVCRHRAHGVLVKHLHAEGGAQLRHSVRVVDVSATRTAAPRLKQSQDSASGGAIKRPGASGKGIRRAVAAQRGGVANPIENRSQPPVIELMRLQARRDRGQRGRHVHQARDLAPRPLRGKNAQIRARSTATRSLLALACTAVCPHGFKAHSVAITLSNALSDLSTS